ncbi:uncharacterized protein A1O5_10071 [Cladophialophora psammophila CBS 110553]|uniref:Pfs domain protein n=1 Tax=Cladophialophora psammophila CBS 110553 TaxID=1182543 RepID=W9WQG2_9EURO|nr:uncharacterized protein A1O5_10071 [Cladophialophora psammophila CBS 110553]EXJ66876.1 hypothetical protein A1O5_10071 [Cladophialophora psammophila CBS 110553]
MSLWTISEPESGDNGDNWQQTPAVKGSDPDEPLSPDSPDVSFYRRILVQSPAYLWLVSRIHTEGSLQPAKPDIMRAEIRAQILQTLESLATKTDGTQAQTFTITFEVDWDPVMFIQEQNYEYSVEAVLPRVIVLTGNANTNNVQASTCLQYVEQTWPYNGHDIIRILQDTLGNQVQIGEFAESQEKELPDSGTRLSAKYIDNKISFTVSGTAYSIAEVGEQLAWLGSALRSSPESERLMHCTPFIKSAWTPSHHPKSPERFTSTSTTNLTGICRIGFVLEDLALEGTVNGSCWHQIMRNPVVVKGYPTLPRLKEDSGLEIPLHILSALGNARRIVDFCGMTYLKGFSTMFAATHSEANTTYWHMVCNQDRSYVSFEDPRVPRDQYLTDLVPVSTLQAGRHILGWCNNVKNLTGTSKANYEIEWSGSVAPHQSCAFERVSISGGKFVSAGATFAIGMKDKAIHIDFGDDYVGMLKVMADRHFVFYDVEAKRAWLVDGASGVLHFLRASLHDLRNDRRLRKLFQFDFDKFKDASCDSSGGDAAFDVLSDEENMRLPLYPKMQKIWKETTTKEDSLGGLPAAENVEKRMTTSVCLRDRVEQICHVLAQITAHQDDVHTQSGVGFRLKYTPRRQLEGFDFMDVATNQGTLWPKVTTIQAVGEGWIDFTRAVHALAFFGAGFGELFQPTNQGQYNCRSCKWNEGLPRNKDYLAVRVADIKDIMRKKGTKTSRPWRLVDDIYWHAPDEPFAYCEGSERCEHDRVQVLLPATFPKLYGLQSPRELAADGAVIFGHCCKFPLRWASRKIPEKADADGAPMEDITNTPFYDPGHTRLGDNGSSSNATPDQPTSTSSDTPGSSSRLHKRRHRSSGSTQTSSSSGLYNHQNQQFIR